MSRALINYLVAIGYRESSKQKFADDHFPDLLVSKQTSGTQMLSDSEFGASSTPANFSRTTNNDNSQGTINMVSYSSSGPDDSYRVLSTTPNAPSTAESSALDHASLSSPVSHS